MLKVQIYWIFFYLSFISHPKENQLSSAISIPLWPAKDLPIDLHIKAMIGYKGRYECLKFYSYKLFIQIFIL